MKKNWIWKGVFLGFVFFLAMLIQRPVGISTQFSVTAGILQEMSEPDLVYQDSKNRSGYGSENPYYNSNGGALAKDIAEPLNYEMIFILGVLLGSFAGIFIAPDEYKKIRYNSQKEGNSFKLYLRLFVGGVALLFGARLAGGCTSGHMMSGMSQMTLSSFIFTMVVFPVAIFVSKMWGE